MKEKKKTNKWIYLQGLFHIQCTILLIKIFLSLSPFWGINSCEFAQMKNKMRLCDDDADGDHSI